MRIKIANEKELVIELSILVPKLNIGLGLYFSQKV